MNPGRALVALVAVAVVAAGCGGSARTACRQIGDDAVARLTEVIATLDAAEGTVDESPLLGELVEITDRARSAGCSFDELNQQVEAAAIGIQATSEAGRFVLGQVRVRGLFFP